MTDEPIEIRLQRAYDRCKHFPEDDPDGFIKLIALRNLVRDAIIEIEVLRAQLDRLNSDPP